MALERPSIVLFDMDGTTVRHINPRILGALERLDDTIFTLSKLAYRRRPHPDFSAKPSSGPSLLVHRALHKVRRKEVEQIVQPCPGVKALLRMLKDNGIDMGIVSNGIGKGYGYDILETFGLTEFFTARIFREDIGRPKPHPDPLLRALDSIGRPVTADDLVWYIGDRGKDVLAALAVGAQSPARVVPLSYGVKGAVALLEHGQSPDQIIMNYTDFAGRIYPLMLQASRSLSGK